MKEHIYTIALTDALAEKCECPLCIIEKKLDSDTVDYSDKSGLAGSVRAEQTEDLSFGDLNRHIVKSHFLTEALADILAFDYSHCVSFISSTVLR